MPRVCWSPFPWLAGILHAALAAADCSLILTTYDQLRLNRELLLPVRWGVAVLDEGHKIRNPDAEVGGREGGGWHVGGATVHQPRIVVI